jgi:hypothetical protein
MSFHSIAVKSPSPNPKSKISPSFPLVIYQPIRFPNPVFLAIERLDDFPVGTTPVEEGGARKTAQAAFAARRWSTADESTAKAKRPQNLLDSGNSVVPDHFVVFWTFPLPS